MRTDLIIEVNDDTLVATEQGIQRLSDILHRPVKPCLWAIKWELESGVPNGITFHRSHKEARKFVSLQIGSKPIGHAKLVNVSDYIMKCVERHDYCWTNLSDFSEAEHYEGESWIH